MQIVMPRGELQVHVAKNNGILRDVFFHEKIEQACQLAVSAVIRNFYPSKPTKSKIQSVLVERLAYTLRVNIE